MHGLASASDTISGQAAGARDYNALSSTLQRSIAVSAVGCALISSLWLNSEPILLNLGQTPDVAAGAARCDAGACGDLRGQGLGVSSGKSNTVSARADTPLDSLTRTAPR